MTEKNDGKKKGRAKTKAKTPQEKLKEIERRALARGLKPVKDLKELARLTPKDADELLAAIREMRESDRE